jgi:hypothetical protein
MIKHRWTTTCVFNLLIQGMNMQVYRKRKFQIQIVNTQYYICKVQLLKILFSLFIYEFLIPFYLYFLHMKIESLSEILFSFENTIWTLVFSCEMKFKSNNIYHFRSSVLVTNNAFLCAEILPISINVFQCVVDIIPTFMCTTTLDYSMHRLVEMSTS